MLLWVGRQVRRRGREGKVVRRRSLSLQHESVSWDEGRVEGWGWNAAASALSL
jgi:hypothetical protein